MKRLYYNPLEIPNRIVLIKGDTRIELSNQNDYTDDRLTESICYLKDLFKVLDDYDDVLVSLTSHNQAYYWKNNETVTVAGEVSLKEFSNGGGYMNDKKMIYANLP